MADLAGKNLGNYRISRLLGRGGEAVVYLGEHVYLQRQTAIKVLRTSLNEEDSKRFLSEAQLLANLSHPHIVRVLDFAVEQGTPYLVMDYAPGGSLGRFHPIGFCLPLSTIVGYMKQIASALQHAHDHKIIHRDIKPENILLNAEHDHLMLSDFGLALLAPTSELLSTQAMEGTVHYMAPEQLRGKPTFASDQYALGIMVYTWLAGNFPFQGASQEIITQHLSSPPPPLHEGVSQEIEEVVLRALQKEPQQRYASVEDFVQALEVAASHTSTEKIHAIMQLQDSTSTQKGTELASSPNSLVRKRTRKALSRRNMLLGLVGASAVVGGTLELASWLQSIHRLPPILAHQAASTATAKLIPHGTPIASPVVEKIGQPPIFTYRGHTSGVTWAAWSPDSTQIVSASSDTTVQIWGATDGSNASIYRGHSALVWVAAWSPDGKRIASAGQDIHVQVWDARTRNLFLSYKEHSSQVITVAWSPHGGRMASAGQDTTVKVWDTIKGNTLLTYHKHTQIVNMVAWSPDGKQIASGSYDTTVQVWDSSLGDKGKILVDHGHSDAVLALAWSPDGKRIASGSKDGTVRVWNILSGEVLTYRVPNGIVHTVSWSPDGKYIVSGGNQGAQVWNATTAKVVYVYQNQINGVESVAWAPNKPLIASASDDKTVQIWQTFGTKQ
jgi:eukaryotic-like serine/threonine-protein kinase